MMTQIDIDNEKLDSECRKDFSLFIEEKINDSEAIEEIREVFNKIEGICFKYGWYPTDDELKEIICEEI